MNLDLDAARAARADSENEPLEVRLDGKTFLAARPVKLATIVAIGELQEGDLAGLKRAIIAIFGHDQAQGVLDAGLSFDDVPLILTALIGGGEGESPASTG